MNRYPHCPKKEVKETRFGYTWSDDYQWLENPQDPQVLEWVKNENEWTDYYFENELKIDITKEVQKKKEKIKEAEYLGLKETKEGYSATRHNPDGTRELVLLDKNYKEIAVLGNDALFQDDFSLFTISLSPTNDSLCFFHGLRYGAGRPSCIAYDLKKKEILGTMDGVFSAVWAKDGKHIIFSDASADPEAGTNANYIRSFNTEAKTSEILLTVKENAVFVTLKSSRDGSWLIAEVKQNYADSWIYALDEDSSQFKLLNEIALPLEYIGTTKRKHYFISYDQAEKGKIIAMNTDQLVSQAENTIMMDKGILESAVVLSEEIVMTVMEDVSSHAYVYTICDGSLHELTLPSSMGTLSSAGLSPCMVSCSDKLFYSFESFTQPSSLFVYENGRLHPCHESKHTEEGRIVVEQIFVKAQDGVNIPAYIVRLKEALQDGNNPVLMYGYGGYNAAMPPSYSNPFIGMDIVDWVKAGGIYVNCNVRGGSEYGTAWHEGGYQKQKKNCFTDFIDIAEYMIQEKWTSPKKIAISGGSNGGLLVCALTTMRPDLWGCVIASVPHTDMIRFRNDERGPMYITEYGDPQQEEMFSYMMSYSPYHNIKETEYPWMYIQTGECDNNVPPYHGKKMAARMQERNQGTNPVLLRVLARGSHNRGEGETYYQTISEMQSFIKKALGMPQ